MNTLVSPFGFSFMNPHFHIIIIIIELFLLWFIIILLLLQVVLG